jgi:DNA polymerase elongation subunit (family B)
MSNKVTFTVEQVLDLMKHGMSQREVARQLGKESQESTVRNMLRREVEKQGVSSVQDLLSEYDQFMANQEAFGAVAKNTVDLKLQNHNHKFSYNRARILFIDIETAPLLGHCWSLWNNNIGLNQLQSDWYIMSFVAKWADSEEIIYRDIRENYESESDATLMSDLWSLLDDADVVVGHNIKKFDMKKINARFILNGYDKPSNYRMIDTLQIAKATFAFTSNKLEYLTDKLCSKYKKSKHGKFAGHKLWAECLKGNMEAWDEMKDYNMYDVLSNQELYEILMAWDNRLPNFDLYTDDLVDMSEWVEDGFHYTNLGKYVRYRNKKTGQQRRGRVNLLPKEKRAQLLANIVS